MSGRIRCCRRIDIQHARGALLFTVLKALISNLDSESLMVIPSQVAGCIRDTKGNEGESEGDDI